MARRFHLPFQIMTNDALEAARTGNWFVETPLAICRLDKLSRNEDVQEKLKQTDWDLIVCDEAHKMSATYFGSEVKYTKRYRLGQVVSMLTRHFLLLTATPHNGKEADARGARRSASLALRVGVPRSCLAPAWPAGSAPAAG
jgi:hypothetical protein